MTERVVELFAVLTDEYPIDFVAVAVTYGEQRVDVLLNRSTRDHKAGFAFDEKLGRAVQVQFRAYATWPRGVQQASFEAPPQTTEAGVIVIDPRQVCRLIYIPVQAMFSMDRYAGAFVDFKVGEAAQEWLSTETIFLNKDASRDVLRVLVAEPAATAIRHRVRFVTQSRQMVVGPWQPTEPGMLVVVDPPMAEPAGV